MRRLVRPALALSLGLTGVLGGAAVAAPKVACNTITDEKGDTFLVRNADESGEYGPQEDAMDIVSGDLVSNGKVITGVIRVANLSATLATSPGGAGYDINFSTPRSSNVLFVRTVRTQAGTTTAEAGFRGEQVGVTRVSTILGTGTTVVDLKKNELRFSFPVSLFAEQGGIKKGDRLSPEEVTAGRAAGPRAVFADVTTNSKPYKVGDRHCVTPGK